MARKPRIEWEGASYHIMARGNERARIFKHERDYELFIETLKESLERFGVQLHAWCLMPNHYHLAASTPRANLCRWMAWQQTTFTARYNFRYKRVGHLFQGRYRAEIVDTDAYAMRLVSYIHLNPVRRNVKGVLEYTGGLDELAAFIWSGHTDLLGVRKKPLLTLDSAWFHYWSKNPSGVAQGYRKALSGTVNKAPEPWSEVVERGLVAGRPDFVEKVVSRLQGQVNADAQTWSKPKEWEIVRKKVEEQLSKEDNLALIAWVRTRLLGEKGTEVGKTLGYTDGSGVTQAAKRLEVKSQTDAKLKKAMTAYKFLSNVKN